MMSIYMADIEPEEGLSHWDTSRVVLVALDRTRAYEVLRDQGDFKEGEIHNLHLLGEAQGPVAGGPETILCSQSFHCTGG